MVREKIHEQIRVKANEGKKCEHFYVYYEASNDLGVNHSLCIKIKYIKGNECCVTVEMSDRN